MISILLLIILGFSLLSGLAACAKAKPPLILVFPFSFLLGVLFIGLELFFISILFHTWDANTLPIANVFLAVALLVVGRRYLYSFWGSLKLIARRLSWEHLGFALIIGVVAFFMLQTQLRHEYLHSDALNYWFMKGKLFYIDKQVSPATLTNPSFSHNLYAFPNVNAPVSSLLHNKYPILPSLAVSWVYLAEFGIEVTTAKYLWLLIELTLLCILYWAGKHLLPSIPFGGIVPMLIYLGMPGAVYHFSVHNFGFADIWVSSFLTAGVVCLLMWLQEDNPVYLMLSSLFLGGAGFCKIEGITALWLLPVILFARKSAVAWYFRLRAVFLAVAIPLSWGVFAYGLRSSGSYEDESITALFTQGHAWISPFLVWVTRIFLHLFNLSKYLVIWPLYLFSIVLMLVNRSPWNRIWIHSLVIVHICFLALTYSLAPKDMQFDLEVGFSRFFMQLVPLVIIAILSSVKAYIEPTHIRKG